MRKKQGIIILSAFFIIISTILLINKPSYAAAGPVTNYCPEEIYIKASPETLSLVPNITIPKNLNITNTSGTSLENTAITYIRDTKLTDSKYVKSYESAFNYLIPTFTSNPTENRYYQQLFAWWMSDLETGYDNNLTKEEKETIKESENAKKLVEKVEEYQKYNDWTYSEDSYSTSLTLDEIDTSKITYTVTNDYIETSLITPDCTKDYSYLFTNYQVEVPVRVIVVDKNGKEQKEFARGEGFKLRIPISSIKNNQASFQATIIGKSILDIWGTYEISEESSTQSTRALILPSVVVNCGKQEELEEFEELNFNYTEEVGNLEIQVIDAETKENLIDAEIVIYDQAGNIVYRYKTTESKINVTLPVGTYTIKQIVTPPNYQARETTITLDVTKDQKAVAVLENVQLISVPDTLKTTTTITMIGITIALLGIVIIGTILFKKKKRYK